LPSLIFFSKCLVLLIEDIVICHPTEAELKKFPNLFFNPNFFLPFSSQPFSICQ
jgi:hypothetical protein